MSWRPVRKVIIYMPLPVLAQVSFFSLILLHLFAAGSNVGFPRPAFLMSWRRRIGKEDESLFFNGCEDAGLEVEHVGSRVYCIKPRD